MDTFLLLLYAAALCGMIVLLVVNIRRPSGKRWLILFAAEALCALIAWILTLYYDSRPGEGMMPGLTYFAETLWSMFAAAAYGGMLVITAAAAAIAKWIREKKE